MFMFMFMSCVMFMFIQVMDPRTRMILFKLLNQGFFRQIDGCLSTGKEANVYYAVGEEVINTHTNLTPGSSSLYDVFWHFYGTLNGTLNMPDKDRNGIYSRLFFLTPSGLPDLFWHP